MNDFSEVSLLELFPKETAVTSYIGLICSSIRDPEAVEETSHFLGKLWTDILPEDWRWSNAAITFFSDFAFYYFLPSIILCSFRDRNSTQLTINGLLGEVLRYSSNPNWNRLTSWQQFNKRQLLCVASWIEKLEATTYEYYSEAERETLNAFLMRLIDESTCPEASMG